MVLSKLHNSKYYLHLNTVETLSPPINKGMWGLKNYHKKNLKHQFCRK